MAPLVRWAERSSYIVMHGPRHLQLLLCKSKQSLLAATLPCCTGVIGGIAALRALREAG